MLKIRRGACAAFIAATVALSAAPTAAAQSSLSSLSSKSNAAQMSSQLGDFLTAFGKIDLDNRSVTVDGVKRPYTLVLPKNYNPMRAYPVILGFGGWQHDAARTRSYEKLEDAAGSRAIVIYPQAINNAWGGAPYAQTSVDTDIRYIRALLNHVASQHNIDRNSVYATGLSNGGGMAAALGCHAPDLVAGVASVAGAYYNPTVTKCARGKVPTLIMHADNDDVVKYHGGTRHGAAYRSVPSVFYDTGRRNGCNMNKVSPRRVGPSTIYTPAGCSQRTELEKIAGGGHTWFRSATDRTVKFFLG